MSKATLLTIAAGLGLAAAQPASAAAMFVDGDAVVGNDAVTASQVDSCIICTFVLNQAFGVAGAGRNVYSFEFFANRVGTITPFLSTRLDTGSNATFTVTSIGTERTAAPGFNQFEFAALTGSTITSANTFFGFAYNSGGNGGVVEFEYTGSGPGTFIAPGNTFPVQGASFTSSSASQQMDALGALNNRAYSINASAQDVLGAVPEPSTWALMILGFGIVGSALRRRRTKVRFNFA